MSGPGKKALRLQFKAQFCKTRPNRAEASRHLCQRLVQQSAFLGATRVGIFLGRNWEPELLSLWKEYPEKCAAPRVQGDQMSFYFFGGEDQLQSGLGGILEPDPRRPCQFETDDLVLVPGLAFDKNGGRLGSGKGFYDKFLATVPPGVKRWGVCFDDQLVEGAIPMDSHDIGMQATLTPSGLHVFHKR